MFDPRERPDLWDLLGTCFHEATLIDRSEWGDVSPAEALVVYGLDELDRQELALIVERHFAIDLPDETLDAWETVGDVADSIAELVV